MPSSYFQYNVKKSYIDSIVMIIAKILKYVIYFLIVIVLIFAVGIIAYFVNPDLMSANMQSMMYVIVLYILFFSFMKIYTVLNNLIIYFNQKDNGFKITKQELPHFYELIQAATQKLGLKLEDIYIVYSPVVNAYAIPLENNVSVSLTSALIETLDDNEILFVVGHELAHIKFNREHMLRQAFYQLAFPWYLEYYADLGGYEACQNLNDCASAFLKMTVQKRTMSHIKLDDYLKNITDKKYSIITKMISTHPPNEKRIYELKKYHEHLNNQKIPAIPITQ